MKKNWKKIIFICCIVALVFWIGYRICAIIGMNNRFVFNATRDALENGTPVVVMTAINQSGVLREPLSVKNNTALVSGMRVGLFRVGQHVGNGEIKSVSSKIDYDSGMYVIKTRNVPDGLQYAEYRRNGYFVPVYAINNSHIFVVNDNVATLRNVVIARQDSEMALITQGLYDGDLVILSRVESGEKIKIQETR